MRTSNMLGLWHLLCVLAGSSTLSVGGSKLLSTRLIGTMQQTHTFNLDLLKDAQGRSRNPERIFPTRGFTHKENSSNTKSAMVP